MRLLQGLGETGTRVGEKCLGKIVGGGNPEDLGLRAEGVWLGGSTSGGGP